MNLRVLAVFTVLVAAAGCLPDDIPVDGKLLYPGIGIESPGFADVSQFGGEPWVFFQLRKRRPDGVLAGQVDLHRVNFADGRQLPVVANVSERPEWSGHEIDADGLSYYMIDERFIEKRGRVVGTLARVDLENGIVDTLPDVASYSLHGSRKRFLYRKDVEEMRAAELHMRTIQGDDRNLGPLLGQVQFVGDNKLYWVGQDATMMRLVGWDSEPQLLRSGVSRFELQYQEKYAIVTVSKPQPRMVVLDLETLQEKPLPVENPCCWQGLRGNVAVFGESATESAPAKLHTYDIVTGKHDVLVLPDGLADVNSIMPRPATAESLLRDSNGQFAIMRPGPPVSVELIPLRPDAPRFTSDGKHLIFIDAEPAPPPPAVSNTRSGRLMAQNADDWFEPPRVLTPPGTSCLIEPTGFLLPPERPRQVIFWARYGLGASDLYLTDLDTRQTLKLAVGIGAVAIGGRNVLGVVRINQDLTGDLVHRDFITGEEKIIEHSVAAATTRDDPQLGPIVAFVVRERMASSRRNGLWGAELKLLPPPEEKHETLRLPATFLDLGSQAAAGLEAGR